MRELEKEVRDLNNKLKETQMGKEEGEKVKELERECEYLKREMKKKDSLIQGNTFSRLFLLMHLCI